MRNKIVGLFALVFSVSSFSFFGGGGPMEVIEIGPNVAVNAVAKIEQAKNTLEAIQQTKNQIVQLKNDALNLNKWAGMILEETVGLTQDDIADLMEIQRMAGSLYKDARDFQKNWKDDLNLDVTKLDINQLGRHQDNMAKKMKEKEDLIMSFWEKNGEKQKKVVDTVKKYTNKNKTITGNLQGLQLANEIASANYNAIKQLDSTIREMEASKLAIKKAEEAKKRVNDQIHIKSIERKLNTSSHDYNYGVTVYKLK